MIRILATVCLLGLLLTAHAQTGPVPSADTASTNASEPDQMAPAQAEPASLANGQDQTATTGEASATDTNEGATVESGAAPATEPAQAFPVPSANGTGGDKELHLNFHGAPIDMVLSYLSDAAGFIIEVDTPLKGKVDVWSSRPVTQEEAVDILNSELNKNGYAAIRNGRKLTIVSKEDAVNRDIPVRTGNNPDAIPNNDEIVTQIIPIRFVEAEQLVKDLSPMISVQRIIANEAGNSIAVTDTQANIRHLVEIIKAIDSSAEDETELRVFHLKHHDPVEVANLLTGLFSDQGSSAGAQTPIRFGPGAFGGFGGFGNFGNRGGFGGGRGGAANTGAGGTANNQADRIKKRQQVVAVADPRTSSVIVTAAKDMIDQIGSMIEQLDQTSPKVAHVSVIHLQNADPQQVQQVLQDMFQSSTSSRNTSTQTSPLMQRIQQNQGTMSSGTGIGTSGLGNVRTGGGTPSF